MSPNKSKAIFSILTRHFIVATCAVLAATTCQADTLYVGPRGDNTRSRAEVQKRSTPWRTIQRGVNAARPGDAIVVLPGTYNERVQFRRSGRRGQAIELRSQTLDGARIVGGVSAWNQRFIVVDGFDVSNFRRTGETKGISFRRCHHVTVRNCQVRDCWGGGIGFDHCDWVLCEWNHASGNAFNDPNQHSGISVYQPQRRSTDSRQYGIIIRNNTSFNNRNLVDHPLFGRPTDGNGIVVDDFFNSQPGGNGVAYDRDSVIENNLCFNNGGQGIHCFLSQNISIRNNTCMHNLDSFDFGGEITLSESRRVKVFNNILIASPERFAAFQFDTTGSSFRFNLFDGPTRDVAAHRSNIIGDAGLIPGTFELRASSRAVNAGRNAGDHFAEDIFGQNRINGRIDIGATERQ